MASIDFTTFESSQNRAASDRDRPTRKSFRFSDMPIMFRIGIALVIPLCGLLLLSFLSVHESYRTYNEVAKIGTITSAVGKLSDLAHVLQVERGQTAAVVGSGETGVPATLVAARKTSDAEILSFLDDVKSGNGGSVSGVDELATDLEKVAAFRTKVQADYLASDLAKSWPAGVLDRINELGD